MSRVFGKNGIAEVNKSIHSPILIGLPVKGFFKLLSNGLKNLSPFITLFGQCQVLTQPKLDF